MKKYEIKIDNMKINVKKGELLLFVLFENNLISQGKIKTRNKGAYCGMGVCQECLISLNGKQTLACQTFVNENIEVSTNE